jgi:hypothetical protein
MATMGWGGAASGGIVDTASDGFGDEPERKVVLVAVRPLRRGAQGRRGDEKRIGGRQDIRFVRLLVCRSHRVPGQVAQRRDFLLKPRGGSRGQDQTGVEASVVRERDGVLDVADWRRGASDQVKDRSSLWRLGHGVG